MEKLWTENERFCRKLARRYSEVCRMDRAVDVEDLTQSAFFGILKAAKSYTPGAGKSWKRWLAWYVVREFNRVLGRRAGKFTRPHSGAASLDAPLDAETDDTLLDIVADESNPDADANLLREEIVKAVREAVEALPDARQRQAVQMVDLEGKTIREAAEALGVPVSTMSGLEHRGRQRLARSPKLRALDDETRFCAYKGVAAFERDWTSTTEAAALWRIEQEGKFEQRANSEDGETNLSSLHKQV